MTESGRSTRARRRKIVLTAAVAVAVLAAAGLYWFQPWKLFVDHRVDDALPSISVAADETSPTTGTAPSREPVTAAPPPRNRVLADGELISHEHDTRGTVRVVQLDNGKRVLTLQDLDTSDRPDVRIWLTDARVLAGERGWYLFDDGRHVSLGDLKGNQGNQVYAIPDDLDLSRYRSVSLWCARFDVSFGAAALPGLTTR